MIPKNNEKKTAAADLPVSVVIPTYNRANLILRALASVLIAIAPGDEVIVIDDGSTDETERVVAPYRDRIRYLRTTNAGAGAARNRGIREAQHRVVAFLDSDDEWRGDKLDLQRRFLAARPDVAYCFTDFDVRKPGGELISRYLRRWHNDQRPWDEILGPGFDFASIAALPPERAPFRAHTGDLYPALLSRNYIATFTLAVRLDHAGDALHFAEDLATHEDWECFGRLAHSGPGAYLDCETATQWAHSGPRLTDADDFTAASARLAVLERVWGSDSEFFAMHGDEYRRIAEELHEVRSHFLLRQGRCREARAELRKMGSGHIPERILAALPGGLVRRLLEWRG